ncbi:MAG: SpoIIIAH-like family protein [Firmicutes bacterium]|nr:SpoIIIAH-like family protein [Bacillota bacterium]
MRKYKRLLWLIFVLLLCGATYWAIAGRETEMQQGHEILPDDELQTVGAIAELAPGDPGSVESGAFFAEYRLQRDRVRAQEIEMLEGVINNENASPEAKAEAEALLLSIVDLMEQELMIENVLKAQGFADAIFFFQNRVASVMVKQAELSEREFVQVTETVAGIVGIDREEVQVIARP